MSYFKKVQVGDKVFGLIQGPLTVVYVVAKGNRMEGFCSITTKDAKGKEFHYTMQGVPSWGIGTCDCQTLFYEDDINLGDVDISCSTKPLSLKKITKLMEKGELEVKCPSGVWRLCDEVPEKLVNKTLKKGHLHLFRSM